MKILHKILQHLTFYFGKLHFYFKRTWKYLTSHKHSTSKGTSEQLSLI